MAERAEKHMKHNKRAQRLLAALCCTALLAGWGGLEAFAKEAPALMTDESDGATAAQLLQETEHRLPIES